jgi:SWI/SNF-related matrix-associated actin-dependent regulator of chromatin subfamily A-like protein 1
MGNTMNLFPHQTQAIQWLGQRPKAILALDMGLGKTCVSALDLVKPALVVCPASLKLNWQRELQMWRPELSVQVIKSPKDKPNNSDVTIINYDILQKVELPRAATLIVDEAHYAKNYKAKRTKVLMQLIKATTNVSLLTGTPIVNRPIELWTLLYSIGATKLGYFEFGMRYCAGWKTPWNTYDFTGSSRSVELAALLKPFMLRLTKAECLKDLPEKTYKVIELDLPVDKREKEFDQKQIAKPDSIPFEAISDILKMNAERKLPDAITYIKDCLEHTDKIVVFAHHTHIIDGLMEALKEFKPVKVTGSVKNEDRQKAVDTFQANKACRVFVGNIKAAGVGLTLTAASHVVFVEASWSPADIQQAADRCHRIGQKDNVTVDLLTISGSIDALVLHSVLTKMGVIDRIIKESVMDQSLIAQKFRELADLFDQQVAAAPKAAKETKPVPSDPAKQIKLPLEPAAAPIDVAAAPTLDDLRQGMAELIGSGKRDKVIAILAKLEVKKVSDIEEDKFAEAMGLINGAR